MNNFFSETKWKNVSNNVSLKIVINTMVHKNIIFLILNLKILRLKVYVFLR